MGSVSRRSHSQSQPNIAMLVLRLQLSLHQVMARRQPHLDHDATRITRQCGGLGEPQERNPRLVASQEGMLSGNLTSGVGMLAS